MSDWLRLEEVAHFQYNCSSIKNGRGRNLNYGAFAGPNLGYSSISQGILNQQDLRLQEKIGLKEGYLLGHTLLGPNLYCRSPPQSYILSRPVFPNRF